MFCGISNMGECYVCISWPIVWNVISNPKYFQGGNIFFLKTITLLDPILTEVINKSKHIINHQSKLYTVTYDVLQYFLKQEHQYHLQKRMKPRYWLVYFSEAVYQKAYHGCPRTNEAGFMHRMEEKEKKTYGMSTL